MTIIVTGEAGFIGSNFIFHMLDKYPDYRIVCLDKLTYAGNLSTLVPVMDHPKFRFVKADICDREAVYQYHFPEKLIPLMIANALADKPLSVYGEGLNVRDWLYVEDHCRAIDLIIHKGRVGEVYNVGGHNEMRNIDIVKMICKELGKPENMITYVADRKGHDMRSTRQKSIMNLAGCRRQNLKMVLRRRSSGIWSIVIGGKRLSMESMNILVR